MNFWAGFGNKLLTYIHHETRHINTPLNAAFHEHLPTNLLFKLKIKIFK